VLATGFAESADAPDTDAARVEIVVAVRIGKKMISKQATINTNLVLNIVSFFPS